MVDTALTPRCKVMSPASTTGKCKVTEVPSTVTRETLMRFVLACVASTLLLVASQVPASAATAGQALVQKPSFGQANAMVEKAGLRHRRWYRYRYYRGPRWGWRHNHYRRWWW